MVGPANPRLRTSWNTRTSRSVLSISRQRSHCPPTLSVTKSYAPFRKTFFLISCSSRTRLASSVSARLPRTLRRGSMAARPAGQSALPTCWRCTARRRTSSGKIFPCCPFLSAPLVSQCPEIPLTPALRRTRPIPALKAIHLSPLVSFAPLSQSSQQPAKSPLGLSNKENIQPEDDDEDLPHKAHHAAALKSPRTPQSQARTTTRLMTPVPVKRPKTFGFGRPRNSPTTAFPKKVSY